MWGVARCRAHAAYSYINSGTRRNAKTYHLSVTKKHDSQRRDRILRSFLRLEIGQCSPHFGVISLLNTVTLEIITFLIQEHFKTVTVTVILGKLIQMTFKTVTGNQWKRRGDCGCQDGNGNGN